jgi:hypothetical protein
MKILWCIILLFLVACQPKEEYFRAFPTFLDVHFSGITEDDSIEFDVGLGSISIKGYDFGIILGTVENFESSETYLLAQHDAVSFDNSFRIDGLLPNTVYYYKFYMTDGKNCLESLVGSFHTQPLLLPMLGDLYVDKLNPNILKSSVIQKGEGDILSLGFCYSWNNQSPSVFDSCIKVSLLDDNNFEFDCSTLHDVNIRAFVITDIGVSYSNNVYYKD